MADIIGTNSGDNIQGGSGNDIIYGYDGADHINAKAGNDTIYGGAGNDQILAGSGDDQLEGGSGDDFLHGGLGTDTAIFSGSIKSYTFGRNGEEFTVSGPDGNDRLLHVERLRFDDALITLGVNNAPIAFDDAASTHEDSGPLVSATSVLANDFDFEGDAMRAVAGTFTGTYGTLSLNQDGTYTYTLHPSAQSLAQGQVVQDVFTYTVTDGSLSDTGTLTIAVTGANDSPVANADSATTAENAAVTVDVLANDTDVDNGAVLTVTGASAPSGQGSASVVGNQVRFDPGSDFDHLAVGQSAAVLVTYSIADQFGATSSSTVTITVTGTNDGPVANADTATTSENAAVTIDVLANDTDADNGAVLTVTAASAPAGQGSASVVGNQVRFDPGSDFDSLAVGQSVAVLVTYSISDEHGATSSSTITVTVTGTNDGPVANPDTANTSENAAVTIDVLGNDTDADNGAVLTVTAASAPAGQGSASVVGNQVRFDPGTDFDHLAVGQSAAVLVTYSISDEHGATSSSSVTVTVTGTNDGPEANPDTATTSENAAVLIDVLANDTDADDGAVLTVTDASAPAGQGSASVVGNQVRFDAGSDFDSLAVGQSAAVLVTYSIADEQGATSFSTITLTVTGTNDGPVANADTSTTSENAAVTIDVLANDTDVDSGAVLTVASASVPAGQGSVSVVGNQVQFDPGSDFDHLAIGQSAVVTIDYSISDEHGAASSSTVTVTVTGTNDVPVANPDAAATSENAAVLIDVLANDTDADNGAVLTVTAASAPAAQGSASVVGNQVQFNPGADFDYLAAGETASVTLSYSIEDDQGAAATSTVTVAVTGTNDAPTIDAANTTATGAVTELPNNDPSENAFLHQADGAIAFDDLDLSDSHSASVSPQGGSYLGTFTLDPVDQAGDSVGWNFNVEDSALDSLAAGETVTQTYTIEISDGNGGIATQDVTVTLTGAADAPVVPAGVWFIDNAAVGSANLGTQADPFTSIAAFNAAQGQANGPAAGHTIYLRQGTGTYAEADGINLLSGQSLIGGGEDLVIGGITYETATGRPVISTTGAGNHGVELSINNKVSGFDIGSTTGAGISDGNGTVGNLLVSNVAKSGTGQIVDIDQGGTIDVTLNSAVSTVSGGGAIDLNGISGSFRVSGATTITGTHSGGGIDVTASTNLDVSLLGTVTFTTAALVGRAINFSGNFGSTGLAITGGGMNLTTTSATALSFQNGGTITITGVGNTITAGTGGAVNITNATIGSGGITLQSASSSGGSIAGIVLDNAGSGGFTVTGIGSTAGSGGTITNKSGADGSATLGMGVTITNTANVSLSNMVISNDQNFGIRGNNVTNFTLRDSSITGNHGNSASALLNEGAVNFTQLTGTALFEGNVISGGFTDNLRVVNTSGTLDLTIRDSANDQAVMGLNNNANGRDSVHIATGGTAVLKLTVDGVDFLGAREQLLEVAASGGTTQDIVLTNNVFANAHANTAPGGGGVLIGGVSTAGTVSVDYEVDGNSFTGARGSALTVSHTLVSGTVHGVIRDNLIGIDDGISGNQGSSGGDGIVVRIDRSGGAGPVQGGVLIQDNSIHDIANGVAGIFLRATGQVGAGALLEAIIDGNVIDEMGAGSFTGLYAQVGNSSELGLEITDNLIDNSGALFGVNAIFLDQSSTSGRFNFPGYLGSDDGEWNGGTASTDLSVFLTAKGNVLINGGFPDYPAGGVDASTTVNITHEIFEQPVWF